MYERDLVCITAVSTSSVDVVALLVTPTVISVEDKNHEKRNGGVPAVVSHTSSAIVPFRTVWVGGVIRTTGITAEDKQDIR